jgi:RNA polymerase sigma factor (sigma-70 family)
MSGTASRAQRFEDLFVATRDDILSFLLRRTAQPADAADVLADTYLVAWRRLEDVPPGEEARLWLFGVARRLLANHHRGARRRSLLAGELGSALERATTTISPADRDLVSRDQLAQLQNVIASLGRQDLDVLTLHVWEGLSPAEIAVVTGENTSTVRVRLHRARQRVRTAVSALDDDLVVQPAVS